MQNLVELEKRCKMSIWSQKSASIQLRTDRLKMQRSVPAGKTPAACRPAGASPACDEHTHTSKPLSGSAMSSTRTGVPTGFGTRARTWPLTAETASLDGPFSAVSKPIFATKYSFCSVFRVLQDFAFLHR